MSKQNFPTVEVYITEITKREIVEINFGGRIEALNREKAMGLADAIIHALITDEKSYQDAMVKKTTCSNCGENSWKECIHGVFCVYCQTQYPYNEQVQTCIHQEVFQNHSHIYVDGYCSCGNYIDRDKV